MCVDEKISGLFVQLQALKAQVTEEPLSDSGRHFIDGYYCDLTQCHHGDTGEFRNREDGQAIALLWNLWKAGAIDALNPAPSDQDLKVTGFRGNPTRVVMSNGHEATIAQKLIDAFATPSPFNHVNFCGWRDKWHPQYASLARAISAASQDLIVSADLVRNKTVGKRLQEHADLLGRIASDLIGNTTPAPADLLGAIDQFEDEYPELYWHIAKGKICAGEPLYGAIITDLRGNELANGESDVSAEDAFQIAFDAFRAAPATEADHA